MQESPPFRSKLISTRTVIAFLAITFSSIVKAASTSLEPCPAVCNGTSRSSWSVYNTIEHLDACERHMMLDFALQTPLNTPDRTVKIRACTLPEDIQSPNERNSLLPRAVDAVVASSLCVSGAGSINVSLDVATAGDGSNLTYVTADTLAQVSQYMTASCDLSSTFSYGQGAIVGVFSGGAIDNAGTVPFVLAQAIAIANDSSVGAPETMFVQRCVPEGSANHIFGVAMNNAGNLSWVQQAVATWSSGVCLNATSLAATNSRTLPNVTFYEYTHPAVVLPNVTFTSNDSSSATTVTTAASTITQTSKTTDPVSSPTGVTPPGPTQTGIISTCNAYALPISGQGCYDFAAANGISLDQLYAWNPAVGACENFWLGEAYCVGVSSDTKRDTALPVRPISYQMGKRSDCSTVTVVSGDDCGRLATECGITPAQFTIYNPNICSTLVPGQRVCCSAGTLPDITPKPNADGSCYAYTVKPDDNCSNLAAAYGLTNAKIESFNNGTTWGWFGCQDLLIDLNICLSTGDPPLPNAVANAQCGPTVVGTEMPTNGTALSKLNLCPLNACCNIWGQCGITPEYCTNHTGPAGNPGTAPAGENGCISNCGTEIANADNAPATYISVGYYESWNWDRPCLNMRAASIDTTVYTHIHWAFASISDSFDVVINDTYTQWDDFKALPLKRIVSFGGWGYSTEPATYDRLRQAMSDANRLTFVNNIVKFLNDEGLDGVDFDWEYPGAPDIPGIPAGLPTDGPNYFTFLGDLRGTLGLQTTKTISFAAPASYWYLQHFPIKQMASEVDYIVYMTYDLHGQWDYGNQWAQEGCANGNCLRSHVNMTETLLTLAMITKAGVPTNLITVGISSYGRSFKMSQAGCTGPECTFTANSDLSSQAAKGECTETAGYISNAEINAIITSNQSSQGIQSWYDSKTDSNYVVYNSTEWIAYMSDVVKESRKMQWKGYNFAGTVDWAVDLMDFTSDDDYPNGEDDCSDCDDNEEALTPWTPCDDGPFTDFDGLTSDTMAAWPADCAAQYTLEALGGLLSGAMKNYTDLMNDGYDEKFTVYAKSVAGSADKQVHDFMMDHGNDYFTCTIVEYQMCCSMCKANSPGGSYCDYCLNGNCYTNRRRRRDAEPLSTLDEEDEDDILSPAVALYPPQLEARGDYNPQNNRKPIFSWINTTQPCPPDYSKRGYGPDDPYEQSIYWKLNDAKSDAFFADLLNATGIPSNKIGFGLHTDIDSCSGSGHKVGDGDDCWNSGYEFGHPFPNGYGAGDVSNPKDLAQAALTNSADLPDQLANLESQLELLAYYGDPAEAVDAVSLPIMMIVQAVESMSVVIQTADKIEEEERKAIILAFISAILFFVPIAGEVLGAVAEVGDIAAIISVMGAAGNAAFDVYTIVDDPKNAPLAIVGLIMAPLALSDVAVVAQAASIRRGMAAEDLAKLGTRVGQRMSKVKSVIGACTK